MIIFRKNSRERVWEDHQGIPNDLMPYVAQVYVGIIELVTIF